MVNAMLCRTSSSLRVRSKGRRALTTCFPTQRRTHTLVLSSSIISCHIRREEQHHKDPLDHGATHCRWSYVALATVILIQWLLAFYVCRICKKKSLYDLSEKSCVTSSRLGCANALSLCISAHNLPPQAAQSKRDTGVLMLDVTERHSPNSLPTVGLPSHLLLGRPLETPPGKARFSSIVCLSGVLVVYSAGK